MTDYNPWKIETTNYTHISSNNFLLQAVSRDWRELDVPIFAGAEFSKINGGIFIFLVGNKVSLENLSIVFRQQYLLQKSTFHDGVIKNRFILFYLAIIHMLQNVDPCFVL